MVLFPMLGGRAAGGRPGRAAGFGQRACCTVAAPEVVDLARINLFRCAAPMSPRSGTMRAGLFVLRPADAFEPEAGIAAPAPVVLPRLKSESTCAAAGVPALGGPRSVARPTGPGRPATAVLVRLLAVAALAVPCLAVAPAAAEPVSRNGNIWDYKAHQPTRAGVRRREQRAGVAASPAQARHNAGAVQQLDQHLLRQETTPLPHDPVSLTPP